MIDPSNNFAPMIGLASLILAMATVGILREYERAVVFCEAIPALVERAADARPNGDAHPKIQVAPAAVSATPVPEPA
jgi:hypothetical protein